MKTKTIIPEKEIARWLSPGEHHWRIELVTREHLPYQRPAWAVEIWEGWRMLDAFSSYNEDTARLVFEQFKQKTVVRIAQHAMGLIEEVE